MENEIVKYVKTILIVSASVVALGITAMVLYINLPNLF